jgi:FtsH-binding integral membrane protein
LVLALGFGINRMSAETAQILFWAYAAMMGLSLGGVFLVFTGASIARAFFISAATFAAMTLYGYTTGIDLSRFGSFLFMGLIGIIIASLVNIFLASDALQFAISVIGVLIFVCLTAYDTQRIKEIYLSHRADTAKKAGARCPRPIPRLCQSVHVAVAADWTAPPELATHVAGTRHGVIHAGTGQQWPPPFQTVRSRAS